jgi:hypothetical protein
MRMGWIAGLGLVAAAQVARADEPALPVIAVLGDRVLVGTASPPNINGRSIFKILTQSGPVFGCEGAFAAEGPGGGPVSAECSDGETLIGDFRVLTDTSGYASFTARPNHTPFHFTFGLTFKEAQKYIRLPGRETLVQGADGTIGLADKPPS